MRAFDERARSFQEYLGLFSGTEPIEDARKSGYIRAVADLLKVELDDTKERE